MTLRDYLIAFFLTEIIEPTVAFLLGYRKPREIGAVLLVNLVTHPLLHYYALLHESFAQLPMSSAILFLLETGVVFAEWGLLVFALPKNSKRSLFFLSAAMNVSSCLLGLVLQAGPFRAIW